MEWSCKGGRPQKNFLQGVNLHPRRVCAAEDGTTKGVGKKLKKPSPSPWWALQKLSQKRANKASSRDGTRPTVRHQTPPRGPSQENPHKPDRSPPN